jgi:hypothetical protein
LRQQNLFDLDQIVGRNPTGMSDDMLRALREAKADYRNNDTDFIFSTWYIENNGRITDNNTMTDSHAHEILQQLPPGKEYTIRVKFVVEDEESGWKYIDTLNAIRQSRYSYYYTGF